MAYNNVITAATLDLLCNMGKCKHKAYVVDDQWGCMAGDTIPIIASFDTADEAAIYISGLEDYETGRYGITGPADG